MRTKEEKERKGKKGRKKKKLHKNKATCPFIYELIFPLNDEKFPSQCYGRTNKVN